MNTETRNILTNKEVIAINQDPLGVEALKYRDTDSLLIWLKPLQNDNWAVCFLNRSLKPKQIEFDWQKEIVNDTLSKRELNSKTTNYKLSDLWQSRSIGDTRQPLKATIAPHDVLVIRLTK
jgi:alpha-galactosidase